MRLSLRSLLFTMSMVALALIGRFAVTSVTSARSLSVPSGGAVYTETNAASGNAVVAFSRSSSGDLAPLATYATGGAGIGGTTDPLQSQYAVVLSHDGRWLFAVNAGSNSITAFAVRHDGTLTRTDTVASGGIRPISLAVHDDRVYVLNNGGTVDNTHGTGNITGFRLDNGRLIPLFHSTRPLSGSDVGASTIAFSRDGRFLLVTERASNTLDRYAVDERGYASTPSVTASAAGSPFGFGFSLHDVAVVSEAAAQEVSSYRVGEHSLTAISTLATNGAAPCWAIVTPSGRYAYVANAGAASLAGYLVGDDGSLTALTTGFPVTTGAGSTPIDVETSHDGQLLFTLNTGTGTIGSFAVEQDGSLSALPALSAFPAASGYQGLAVW